MAIRPLTGDGFLKDVATHKMTVPLDNGLYRHVRFRKAETNWNLWFDLVTWPGMLTIAGDMGTWTFARVEDMFKFFRDKELRINPSYWSEKIQTGVYSGREQVQVYDHEEFGRRLIEQLSHYFSLEGDDLEAATQAVKDEILRYDNEWEAKIAARDFTCELPSGEKFEFDACELPSGKDYAYHFLWCLYAIVWGIQQYDAQKGQ